MTFSLTIKTPDDLAAEAALRDAEQAASEAGKYLAETDWLITRQAETGKAVPDDVASKRAEARETISNFNSMKDNDDE